MAPILRGWPTVLLTKEHNTLTLLLWPNGYVVLLLLSVGRFPFYALVEVGATDQGEAQQCSLLQNSCQHSAIPATRVRKLPPPILPSGGGRRTPTSTTHLVQLSLNAALRRAVESLELAMYYTTFKQLQLLASQSTADCVELIGLAYQRLQMVVYLLSQLASNSIDSSSSLFENLKLHLSFSLSYQAACSDGLQVLLTTDLDNTSANTMTGLEELLKNQNYLSQFIGNALTLVDQLQHSSLHTPAIHGQLHPARSSHSSRNLVSRKGNARRPLPPTKHAASPTLCNGSHDRVKLSRGLLSYFSPDWIPAWLSPTDRRLLLHELNAPTPAAGPSNKLSANVVVAQDGSGDFPTITSALENMPPNFQGRFVVYIKAGVYEEVFNVTGNQENVSFMGDGIGLTIITGSRNVASGLFNTFRTSTVGISGDGFFARDITFRNTAGPKGHQAVALRASADRVVFFRCSFEGFQDTLYALSGRQFYRESEILGTVDFIFGYATALFQNCKLVARLPMKHQSNIYTAQGRKHAADVNGFAFHNCTITGEDALLNASLQPVSTFLGRPWGPFSRVVFMQSEMGALVDPQGWIQWNKSDDPFNKTLFYGEFRNRGPGSSSNRRVNWSGVHANMTLTEANQFTLDNFIQGTSWISSVLEPIYYFSSLF